MSSARVTVVIVTWRSASSIGDCLRPLREACAAGVCECVVVDNASPDDTRAILREHESWARIVDSGGNIGFGRGCNLGLSVATTPYVMFLNPDARVAAETIRTLERFMDQHERAAIAAPAIHEPDDAVQHVGVRTSPGVILREASGRPVLRTPVRPGAAPFRTDWVCGAAMFCRAETIRSLGGFDPRFFLYFEETDLCRRVEHAGMEIWAVGEAVAHHANAVSARAASRPMFAGCIAEHYFRSRFYYLSKHWGWFAAAVTELAEIGIMGVRAAIYSVTGRCGNRFAERMVGPVLRMPGPIPAPSPSVSSPVKGRA